MQQRPAAVRARAARAAVRCAAVPPAIEKVAGDQVRRLQGGPQPGQGLPRRQLPVAGAPAAATALIAASPDT